MTFKGVCLQGNLDEKFMGGRVSLRVAWRLFPVAAWKIVTFWLMYTFIYMFSP